MNEMQNRHPGGTSLGGRWAPSASSEVDTDDVISEPSAEAEAFSLVAERGDDSVLRYPDSEALIDDLEHSAREHPDVRADLSNPDSPSSRTYDALGQRVPGLPGSEEDYAPEIAPYSQVREAVGEEYPGVSTVEADARFARIEFCAQRMTLHLQGNDEDREVDETDERIARDAGVDPQDSEALVRCYSSHLQRELGLLEESNRLAEESRA